MYSAKSAGEQEFRMAAEKSAPKSAKQHQDVSPELKEVMHLLKMLESGKDLKGS
ncbi:MAG: hypothetical protein ACR2OL_10950 [Anderseniella sp.]